MARNKYPEKTIAKILDVSLHLFSEKGYEKTTIQDIVNALGMSKGAIYHHFKSKEEIAIAICSTFYGGYDFSALLKDPTTNGLEKIQEILRLQLSDEPKKDIDVLSLKLMNDPLLFVMQAKENDDSTNAILPFIELGIKDSSIDVQDAKSTASLLSFLMNIWIYSPIASKKVEDMSAKIHYLRILCERMGIPILNDELETLMITYYTHIILSS
ncbi:MAG: TetR/AcrR family transcriptional regulator [Longicatena sp.]